MEVLQDSNPIDVLEEILEAVDKQEKECLNRVFLRHCFLNGLAIDQSQITKLNDDKRRNYSAYWYKLGTPKEAFLMSAELIIEAGQPKLNVIFNANLIAED